VPDLSIVTGTYNRLPALQRMITSVDLPRSLSYEFVVVDGGSTDGTLDWCRTQPHIRLIEHGALLGAIRAFTDGALSARAGFVILANDDIEFESGAIVRALAYLDSHPTCGAVAFADNRPAPGYAPGYKVQTMPVLDQGKQVNLPYAQVGLYRKWLGDLVGWWGADDPIMGKSRTYGGDNYLSARIWEHGYTVDVLPGVQISDRMIEDGLRAINYSAEAKQPGIYYKRYPTPPVRAARPTIDNPDSEHLRILYLPIYEPGNVAQHQNKRGLREALQRVGWVYEVDYLSEPFILAQLVDRFQPHLLLTQLHGANELTPAMIAEARAVKPDMVCVNWNGDAHMHGLTAEPVLALLKRFDLQLVVNAYPLPVYEAWGIQAAYWQIGYEEPLDALPALPAYDVVFLGNCHTSQRREMESALIAEISASHMTVGLYGNGWKNPAGVTLYDFAAGEAIYRQCKIAIGDQFWGQTHAFVSNRMFQALAAGAFFLQQHSPGLDEYTGLKDGVHYVSWTDAADLQMKIRYWIQPKQAAKREKIRLAGQAFVREHYSFDAQVRKLFDDLIPRITEGARAAV
jgi:glycosyltransferase involved in cell wall biosynthesis